MDIQLVLLAGLWMAYGALHSLLAASWFKERMRGIMGHGFIYYRIIYVLFAFVSLAGIFWYQFHLPGRPLFRPTTGVRVLGAAIALCGLGLMAACIKKYFIGLSGLLSIFRNKETHELIISGVHRYVRHPLYLGTFIFIWGLLLVFPQASLLVMDLVITIYTLIAIPFEEKKLILAFGQSYIDYRRRVPRLIPRRTNRNVQEHNGKNQPFTD